MDSTIPAESRIDGSRALPFLRLLAFFCAAFFPFFVYTQYARPIPGYSSSTDNLIFGGLCVALLSVFAWLSVVPIAISIEVSSRGVSITERIWGRGGRATRVIPWSGFRTRIKSNPIAGTMLAYTSGFGPSLTLTKKQVGAILEHPDSPFKGIPPRIHRRLRQRL
jgi:hypothetical protein